MLPLSLILINPDAGAYAALRRNFASLPHTEAVCCGFEELPNYDCLVSPANSFGIMDGGMDLAITRFFGSALMDRVQQRILEDFMGEQPVGTSIIVETGNARHPYLAHTPTMRIAEALRSHENVYYAMWAMLLAVRVHNRTARRKIQRIACPALGAGTGHIPAEEAARLMALAYRHFLNPPQRIDWAHAMKRDQAIVNALGGG